MSSPTPVSTVTDAVSGMQGDLLTVAGAGLGIGAAILIVRKGWSLAKRFIG